MKGVSPELHRDLDQIGVEGPGGVLVERIGEQRGTPNLAQMNADLVCSSGLQPTIQKSRSSASKGLQNRNVRDGTPPLLDTG